MDSVVIVCWLLARDNPLQSARGRSRAQAAKLCAELAAGKARQAREGLRASNSQL